MHNFLGTKHDLYFFLATVLWKGCVVFLTGVRVLVVGVLVIDSRALSRARFILVTTAGCAFVYVFPRS